MAVLFWGGIAHAQNYGEWLEVAFLDTLEYGNSESRMALSISSAADRPDVMTFVVICQPTGRQIYVADRGQTVGASVSLSFDGARALSVPLTPAPNGLGGTTNDDSAIDFALAGMGSNSVLSLTYDDSGYTHEIPLTDGATATPYFVSNCAALLDGSYDVVASLAPRADRAEPYGNWLPLELSVDQISGGPSASLMLRTDGATRSNAVINARCGPFGTAVTFMDTVVPFLPADRVAFGVGDDLTLIGIRRLGIDPPAYGGWSPEPVLFDTVMNAFEETGILRVHYVDSNHMHIINFQGDPDLVRQMRAACAEYVPAASNDNGPSEDSNGGWAPVRTVDTDEGAYGRRLTLFVARSDMTTPVFAALGCGPGFMRVSVMDNRTTRQEATSILTYQFDDGPEKTVEVEWQAGGVGTSYDESAVQDFLFGIAEAARIRFQIGANGLENDVQLVNGEPAARQFLVGCTEG